MIFADMPLADAEGALLAHGVMCNGRKLRKGHVLTQADISALADAGLTSVMAVRLEDNDVPEDAAAETLAQALLSPNLHAGAPFTGRCNLYADAEGVLAYNPQALTAINRVHESLTLAVLPPHTAVHKGDMVATIKIIPFAVDQRHLDIACTLAGGLLSLAPFRPRKVLLIETLMKGATDASEKLKTVTRQRLAGLGSTLDQTTICNHSIDDLAARLKQDSGKFDLILIAGASAITDRRDVIPAALTTAGGEIVHFGLPVDPGNLLLLGDLNGKPVIGLPGCARSPKINGLDWVLQRVCAGLPVTPAELTGMGTGGLLKEVRSRGQPRDNVSAQPARRARITALLLAAGTSSRMGDNKLLLPLEGKPLVRHVADHLLASQVADIVCVLGRDADVVKQALPSDPRLSSVENPDFAQGMSTSLLAGLAQLSDDVDGVLVCLGDMPKVTAGQINRLLAAYDPDEGRHLLVPTWEGKWGNPVLWDRRYLPEMRQVTGDKGAREILHSHAADIFEVPMLDDAVLRDADTPEALKNLQGS